MLKICLGTQNSLQTITIAISNKAKIQDGVCSAPSRFFVFIGLVCRIKVSGMFQEIRLTSNGYSAIEIQVQLQ